MSDKCISVWDHAAQHPNTNHLPLEPAPWGPASVELPRPPLALLLPAPMRLGLGAASPGCVAVLLLLLLAAPAGPWLPLLLPLAAGPCILLGDLRLRPPAPPAAAPAALPALQQRTVTAGHKGLAHMQNTSRVGCSQAQAARPNQHITPACCMTALSHCQG